MQTTNTPQLSALIIDKQHPECCSIDTSFHIAQTLGSPIVLPDAISDLLAEHWANSDDVEPNLLALFALITGVEYHQVCRDTTYNHETDLDSFFVFTVYAPIDCSDWCWQRDCFVVVEVGSGGDPRYCSYSAAEVYRLDDTMLGDCCFLDWRLGWWLQPISDRYYASDLDELNDECSSCYSSSPYYQLAKATYAKPIWSDKHGCYIARPKGVRFPCKVSPVEPCYG